MKFEMFPCKLSFQESKKLMNTGLLNKYLFKKKIHIKGYFNPKKHIIINR